MIVTKEVAPVFRDGVGMSMSKQLCISLLSKCRNLKSVKQIHALLFKTGLHNDPLVAGKFLLHRAVSISDALQYAHRLFLHFPTPDVFMYNTLIRGLAESESPLTSLQCFIQIRRQPTFLSNSFSFAFILKGVANFRDLKSGMQLHGQSLCFGLKTHIFVGTTLINVYAECGNLDFAHKAFDEMWQPNVVTWNAIVTACFRCGDLEGAEDTFKRMPIRNLTSWNVMLAGYTKTGELELGRRVFSEMPLKDDVSWSTMIVGFAQNGSFHEAFGLFRELKSQGIRPNEVSLIFTPLKKRKKKEKTLHLLPFPHFLLPSLSAVTVNPQIILASPSLSSAITVVVVVLLCPSLVYLGELHQFARESEFNLHPPSSCGFFPGRLSLNDFDTHKL